MHLYEDTWPSTRRSRTNAFIRTAVTPRPAELAGGRGGRAAICPRDVMPSFGKARHRWPLTVRGDRYSRSPICLLLNPSPAILTICSSLAVSHSSGAQTVARRLLARGAQLGPGLVSPDRRPDAGERGMGRAQGFPGFRDLMPAVRGASARRPAEDVPAARASSCRSKPNAARYSSPAFSSSASTARAYARWMPSASLEALPSGDELEVADDAVSVVTLPGGNCGIAQEGDPVEALSQVVTGVRVPGRTDGAATDKRPRNFLR